MDKPLNQLNAFFALAEERMLKGSDQLLYFHLFNLFNKAHWKETICVSDTDLMNAMRLYDSTGKPANVNTIRNAKSRLKLKGFIDFKPGKGSKTTEYSLVTLYPCDTPCAPPYDTPCDTPCDTVKVYSLSYNLKEDKKTKDKEEEDAHTREVEKVEGKLKGGQLSLPSQEVLETWNKCKGAKLDGNQLLDLTHLENTFGTVAVKKVMETASLKNNYDNFPKVTYTFFKMMWEGQKGREDNDRRTDNEKVNGMASNARAKCDDFNEDDFRKFIGDDN